MIFISLGLRRAFILFALLAMEGAAPVDSAPVPVPEAAPAPTAPSGDSPSSIQGVIQAHSDFLAWLYQPHGALFDKAMGHLDASGVRREHVFYGLFGLLALCLCVCSSAPLLSALITVFYPAFSSASAIKDVSQSPRWMVYWTLGRPGLFPGGGAPLLPSEDAGAGLPLPAPDPGSRLRPLEDHRTRIQRGR